MKTQKLHKDLQKKGFERYFEVKKSDLNKVLKYFGKKVMFKNPSSSLGILAKTEIFKVGGAQYNFEGKLVLRVYGTSYKDTFGRCMSLNEMKLV
jgi:hypothetical protein